MLPPVTRNVHSPHASFSNTSGSARQYLAQFEDCGIGIVILARMRHRSAYFLFVAIHQVLPEVSFTPPTQSPQVMSAGSRIDLAPRLTARL